MEIDRNRFMSVTQIAKNPMAQERWQRSLDKNSTLNLIFKDLVVLHNKYVFIYSFISFFFFFFWGGGGVCVCVCVGKGEGLGKRFEMISEISKN